ncbi:MAG: DUF496 family protein [Sphingorhabdus sp.]|uniref:DUF496 family protein n=1 Tax=Sphingorhabdus sp. TaxID=1902408 RepID=UPI003CB8B7A1
MVKKKWFKVEQVAAELNKDRNFINAEHERDARVQEEGLRYLSEEKPIRDELKSIGVIVEDLWDFVNGDLPTPEAARIIKSHMAKDYSDKVTDALIRSVMDKKYSGYITKELIDILSRKPFVSHGYRPYLRHTIADALRITGSDISIDMINKLIIDDENKDIVSTLLKIRKKKQ